MVKAKPYIINTAIIFLGALFLAVGVNLFFVPSKICAGGVSSLGTILYYKSNGTIHLSYTNTVANLVLIVLGLKFLGKGAVLKSVVGVISLSVWLEVTSYIDITIDGDSWKHVGSTLVFAQEKADWLIPGWIITSWTRVL